MKRTLLPACMLLPAAAPVAAQSMPGMVMGGAPAANEAASTRGYREAMTKMDQGMNIPCTGDADRNCVAGMVPHHQGAIDMARVEPQYGNDPALNKLAREIVAAQAKEIAFMRQWQARHAK